MTELFLEMGALLMDGEKMSLIDTGNNVRYFYLREGEEEEKMRLVNKINKKSTLCRKYCLFALRYQ